MGGSPVRWPSDPPRPPDRAPPRPTVDHLDHLDTIETELADVTERALALIGDAVTAQRRLHADMLRLVVASLLATILTTAGLCLATLVLLL